MSRVQHDPPRHLNLLILVVCLAIGTHASAGVEGDIMPVSTINPLLTQVDVAATTNITISSPGASVGGLVLTAGARVLLTGQSAPATNHIYVWWSATTPMTRALDADASTELIPGTLIVVRAGTLAGNIFHLTNTAVPTLGTSALTYQKVGAGNGLTAAFNVLAFGATPDGGGDDAAAFQAADDAANAYVNGGVVYVPCGDYTWTAAITKRGTRWIGEMERCVTVVWNGTDGVTAITQTDDFTWGGISYMAFHRGTGRPGTWLNVAGGAIDKFWKLQSVQFLGTTGIGIKVGSWINLHWEDLRFDHMESYAIQFKPGASQNLSSAVIDKFSYDHQQVSPRPPSPGFVHVDASSGVSNAGLITIANGRVEVNTAWAAPQALVTYTHSNSQSATVKFENVTYDDISGMTGDVAHYFIGASGSECFMLDNVRGFASFSAILGNWPAGHFLPLPTIPGFASMSHACGDTIRDYYWARRTTNTFSAFRSYLGSETVGRWEVQADGKQCWGDGVSVCDSTLERVGAAVLDTNSALRIGGKIRTDTLVATVSACGTSPVIGGTDNAGTVTAGTGSVTSCLVTFSAAWFSSAPPCICQNQTTEQTLKCLSTTTTLTISSATDFAGDRIDYHCIGRN